MLRDPRYWERASIADSINIPPPRLQAMLDQDISSCVFEIKENNRNAAIRSSIPAEIPDGSQIGGPAHLLGEWDTPERFGALRAEHDEYHDFEGCMTYKGWRRVDTLTPDMAAKSRKAYIKNLGEDPEPNKKAPPEDPTSPENASYLNF